MILPESPDQHNQNGPDCTPQESPQKAESLVLLDAFTVYSYNGNPDDDTITRNRLRKPPQTLGQVLAGLRPIRPDDSHRRRRYALQSTAVALLRYGREQGYYTYTIREAGCVRYRAHGVEYVEVRQRDGRSRYGGVQWCAKLWTCAVCSEVITRHRANVLELAHASWQAAGGSVALVTLTLQHRATDDLSEVLATIAKAWNRFGKNRRWKRIKADYALAGYVYALEVTWSKANGWHPHYHVLMFFRQALADTESPAATIWPLWRDSVAVAGGYANESAFDFRVGDSQVLEYITKYGRLPSEMAGKRSVASETVGGSFKDDRESLTPPAMLSAAIKGNRHLARLWIEYAQAFTGRKQLQWSDDLRQELNIQELSDSEILERQERQADRCQAMIGPDTWLAICEAGMRADVLALAESVSDDQLQSWLIGFVKDSPTEHRRPRELPRHFAG
jgi:hypothetical protein